MQCIARLVPTISTLALNQKVIRHSKTIEPALADLGNKMLCHWEAALLMLCLAPSVIQALFTIQIQIILQQSQLLYV